MDVRIIKCICIMVVIAFAAEAQSVLTNLPQQDCFGAIRICQTNYSNTNAYSGSGLLPNEINPAYSCLATGEKNDVWYTFTTQSSGFISFTITPFNNLDDYDWAVFNISSSSCSEIYIDSSLQVSCNYDANVGCNGVTGANGNFTSCGQTEAVITVMAGQTYVINVSNYSSSQSGYTIDFSASTAQIFDNAPPQVATDTVSCNHSTVTVFFNEHVDCNTLALNGTDFFLLDAAGNVLLPLSMVIEGCDSLQSYTTAAHITFDHMLSDFSSYFLIAKSGSDGNTFSDICGNFVAAGDTLALVHAMNNAAVSLGNDLLICKNESMTVLTSPVQNAVSNWFLNNNQIAANAQHIYIADTGMYVLQAHYGLQCVASDTVQVSYKPSLDFSLGNDTTVCNSTLIPLLTTGVQNADVYTWQLNAQVVANVSPQYQPLQGGVVVTTILKNGYCSATDTITITVLNIPEIDLGDDKQICINNSIVLDATLNVAGTYTWLKNGMQTGVDSSMLEITEPGVYQLVFTARQGCVITTNVSVIEQPKPLPPLLLCPQYTQQGQLFLWNQTTLVDAYEVSSDNGLSWIALGNTENSILIPENDASIILRSVKEGCYSDVVFAPLCDGSITKILTGNYNYFETSGFENAVKLEVYDSMGKQVYADINYQNNWLGKELSNGVYFYTIRYAKAKYKTGKFLVHR